MFRVQRVSNYGTSTPAVARTFYQGCEILAFFDVSETRRDEAKRVLFELQQHLVRCVEIRDSTAQEVATAHEEVKARGFEFQASGRVVVLPSVPGLQSRAESFLQSAKLAIRDTALLVKPFYGGEHDHRYDKLAAWAKKQLGPNDMFTQAVKKWEPWVKRVVDMRNAVDHPNEKPFGKLITTSSDISGTPSAPELTDPTWGLSDQPQRPVVAEMDEIIEKIIELGEEILVGLFHKLKRNLPLTIYEVPAEERDPTHPTRLRVGFASNAEHA